MRIFLSVLILILNLQSWIKADDIRDFEIEGISVGDNLLDHFTIDEINNAYKNTYPKSKKFYGLQFDLNTYEMYKHIQIHLENDSNYIVSSILGGEFFDDINKCYPKQQIIVKDLKNTFPNAKFYSGKNFYPDDPESTITISEFYLSNFEVLVYCTDWSKKAESTGSTDNLRVEISTIEFSDFIRNEAY
tara:strand:+ start:3487 stop:4053 length:567 start_codon:yes stop_codon:yes gene_type:complete